MAVILVDARSGVVEQTRRHAAVAALLRVDHVVLAVNKMDLVDYAEDVFDEIVTDFAAAAAGLALSGFSPIPVARSSATTSSTARPAMDWYSGPSLLEYLEAMSPRGVPDDPGPIPGTGRDPPAAAPSIRDYRGYAGRVEGGTLRARRRGRGAARPAGRTTIVGIDTPDGELADASAAPQSVTAAAGRRHRHRPGRPDRPPTPPRRRPGADRHRLLAGRRPLRPGARVLLRHTTRSGAGDRDIESRLDIATLASARRRDPSANDIGTDPAAHRRPADGRRVRRQPPTGAFLLVDEADGTTLTAGLAGASFPDAAAGAGTSNDGAGTQPAAAGA